MVSSAITRMCVHRISDVSLTLDRVSFLIRVSGVLLSSTCSDVAPHSRYIRDTVMLTDNKSIE